MFFCVYNSDEGIIRKCALNLQMHTKRVLESPRLMCVCVFVLNRMLSFVDLAIIPIKRDLNVNAILHRKSWILRMNNIINIR